MFSLHDFCTTIVEQRMNISVYRKAQFNAAHRLHVESWSDEENKAVFGLCNNPNFHGHNYELIVKVTGELDTVSGMLIDMKDLKTIIEREVCIRFDHKNLNLDTEEFKKTNPTCENIAVKIWQLLRPHIKEDLELSIKLYETPRNFVKYNGK